MSVGENYMSKAMWVIGAIFYLNGIYGSPYFTNGYVKSGTYEFIGRDAEGNPYSGRAIIKEYGKNYRVVWKDKFEVLCIGIGILRNDVFSVSFSDLKGGGKGVISYEMVSNFELAGEWAEMNDQLFGLEKLTYISPFTQ